MTNYILDGRKSVQSFTTFDGYILDIVKSGKAYSVQVCFNGQQSGAEYPLMDGTKEEAQALVNEYMSEPVEIDEALAQAVKQSNIKQKGAIVSAMNKTSLYGYNISHSKNSIIFITGNIYLVINNSRVTANMGDKKITSKINEETFNAIYSAIA